MILGIYAKKKGNKMHLNQCKKEGKCLFGSFKIFLSNSQIVGSHSLEKESTKRF